MTPVATNDTIRRSMRSNRSKNTKPELRLRHALFEAGLRGYRLHHKDLPGKPDLVWIGRKVAVFVHGCFWHRCPVCEARGRHLSPQTNTEFWDGKVARNRERFEAQSAQLSEKGFRVVVIWECQIKKSLTEAVSAIREALA